MLTLNFCTKLCCRKKQLMDHIGLQTTFCSEAWKKLGKNVSSWPEFRCMKNLPSILKLLFVELLLTLTSFTNDIVFQAQASLFAS